jgi:hypothetical protein
VFVVVRTEPGEIVARWASEDELVDSGAFLALTGKAGVLQEGPGRIEQVPYVAVKIAVNG